MLDDMKAKLAKVLAPLDTPFGEFKTLGDDEGVTAPPPVRKKKTKPR